MGAAGGAADRLQDGALHGSRAASRTTTSCGAGRSRTSRASGARSGSCTRSGPRRSACSRAPRCRAPSGSPARELNYAEHLFRGARGAETAIVHASESRPLAELSWDELARSGRALRRRAAAARAWAAATGWSPTCRTWPRPWSRSWPRRRSGRSGRAARPSSARRRWSTASRQIEPKVLIATEGYRYGGRDFDRRERVREIEAALPSLEHTVMVPSGWDDAAVRAGRAGVRAGALRPSALGAVLVGHDRPAEGDRAGPRRHPARAPEEAEPALRPVAGRSLLLVHDDRLDDVELPRRRAARGLGDRALRRPARPARAVGVRGRGGRHLLRHERGVHRRVHEGGRRAAGAAAAAQRRVDRLAACRSRGSSGSTTSSATCGCSRRAAAPTCARPSSAPARCCRCAPASCRRARWARRSRRGTSRAARWSTRSASW